MRLDLSAEEAETLRDYLDRRLGDISMEISHTDNPAYRHLIRSDRDTLRRVFDKLVRGTEDVPAEAAG